MSRGPVRSEVRRRLPRIVINITVAFLFWIVSQIGPIFVKDVVIPGISIPPPFDSISSIVGLTATLIAMVFFVRAISDILFFADLSAEIIVRSLGIKERRPLKRIARDFTYIILTLLLATAASPILSSIPHVGGYLTLAVSLIALGIFLVLIYDIGKVIHGVLQEKTKRIADWISSFLEEKSHRNNGKVSNKKGRGE